jgi:hypothetical protein
MLHTLNILAYNTCRYDTDVAPIIYQSTDARCLQELHECAKKVKMNYGVLHRPIFNIELNKVDKWQEVNKWYSVNDIV